MSDVTNSDMNRTTSIAGTTSFVSDRISLPYPGFSRAHSKEAIVSRESLAIPSHTNPLTPDQTDVDTGIPGGEETHHQPSTNDQTDRPPSPPETDIDPNKEAIEEEEANAGEETPKPAETLASETTPRVETPRIQVPEEVLTEESTKSASPLEALKEEALSGLPLRDEPVSRPRSRTTVSRSASRNENSRVSRRSVSSSQATYVKPLSSKSKDKLRSESRSSKIKRTTSTRSHRHLEPEEGETSPSSVPDSSPKTPTQTAQFPPSDMYPSNKPEPPTVEDMETFASLHQTAAAPSPLPPPPPPVLNVSDVPRVDYLLQNGGLAYPAPKNFLAALPRQNGTRPSNPPLVGAETLFAPFFNLLDQYNTVLNKQGSIAVATGHRSVARRLLDRLENVFSRDLPPNGCSCVMCEAGHEIHRGLNWGDVLEWVSGRIELPPWPPVDLAEIGTKAAEVSAELPPRPQSPVKLDPDIAEEFREHYLRQTKKVRSAVDRWLSNTGETPVPPPQDLDDETLTFAVLTSLDPEDRPYFNALLTGSKELRSGNRAPTPVHRPRSDFIIKTGLSLQRLYRLPQAPRDAESAIYLIKNHHTHDLLVTLANINNSEWEILISGRFDGFLWSGADDDQTHATPVESRGPTPASGYYHTRTVSPAPSRQPSIGSRATTPFSPYSRGSTPASFVSLQSSGVAGRQAVSNDEEMEMAAIAEIEREIYKGMETLEDAFEKLHLRAEVVRTGLRQRGAGLMQSLQNRRRIDVYAVPSSGNSLGSGYERPAWAQGSECESESEWGADDVDILPDDSASNISSSRHRRPKRRTERRTPAPIDEEDEEER